MKYPRIFLFAGILLLLSSYYSPAQPDRLDQLIFPLPFDASQNAEMLKQIRKAAQKGEAAAQFSLGLAYIQVGLGFGNYKEAVKWIRKAAEQGHAAAEHYLGLMYSQGNGIRKDLTEGAKWIRKSAEHGNLLAQYQIGLAYSQGNGVSKDPVEGALWLRKAADQGFGLAQYRHIFRGMAFPGTLSKV